ncbi:Transcription factor PIF1 [Cardamine amara subsp. amara]|uniref:Transcription factor PIF1 n=1 Tax=Cardamine amara subsp. amara TaxID=228776 RepID=A0ABD1C973_CARAN
MLDEAIEYMISLPLQIHMMSMGCDMMPMMYTGMQQYMTHMPMGMNQPLPPHAFMPFPNMLGTQRPFPTQTHMGGSVFSAPHYPDPSRVFVPNQQCNPTSICN